MKRAGDEPALFISASPVGAWVFWGSGFVQHAPQLSLLCFGEGRGPCRLRLQKSSEKDAVVELGTDGT